MTTTPDTADAAALLRALLKRVEGADATAASAAAASAVTRPATAGSPDEKAPKPSPALFYATKLRQHILRLFTDPTTGEPYALASVGGVVEALPLRRPTPATSDWIAAALADDGHLIGDETEKLVCKALRLEAKKCGDSARAWKRVAREGGYEWIDLCDGDGHAVRVAEGEWSVVANPPVAFARPEDALPLPLPERPTPEHPGDLARYVNLSGDDFLLAYAWLVAALRAADSYALLLIEAEADSGKSTVLSSLLSLSDPNNTTPMKELHDYRDLFVPLEKAFAIAFDNVSRSPKPDVLDALCVLADPKKAAITTRELGKTAEGRVFRGARPVAVASVADRITRDDVLTRAAIIRLHPIPDAQRTQGRALAAEFERELPYIFGRVLDDLALARARLAESEPATADRMYEYATLGLALFGDDFRRAFAESRARASSISTAACSWLDPLLEIISSDFATGADYVELAPSVLFDRLSAKTPYPRPDDWPRKANALGTKLREQAANLRAAGIDFSAPENARPRVYRFARLGEQQAAGLRRVADDPDDPDGLLS